MHLYNSEKFTLVECKETHEQFGIRTVYSTVFDQEQKEVLFPCHKFNQDGNLEEMPTVFKKRRFLQHFSQTE